MYVSIIRRESGQVEVWAHDALTWQASKSVLVIGKGADERHARRQAHEVLEDASDQVTHLVAESFTAGKG